MNENKAIAGTMAISELMLWETAAEVLQLVGGLGRPNPRERSPKELTKVKVGDFVSLVKKIIPFDKPPDFSRYKRRKSRALWFRIVTASDPTRPALPLEVGWTEVAHAYEFLCRCSEDPCQCDKRHIQVMLQFCRSVMIASECSTKRARKTKIVN